jgi:tRNA(fMet)-specific endonuclease VapC
MYILDTDLFSLTDRAETTEGQRLRGRLATLRPGELATTIITFEEQMRGWLAWLAQARSLEQQIERYDRLKLMVLSYRTLYSWILIGVRQTSSSVCKSNAYASARWI